jgi:hypothetical protein
MRRTAQRGKLRLIRSHQSRPKRIEHLQELERSSSIPSVTSADIQLRCELLSNLARQQPDRVSGLFRLIDIAARSHRISAPEHHVSVVNDGVWRVRVRREIDMDLACQGAYFETLGISGRFAQWVRDKGWSLP